MSASTFDGISPGDTAENCRAVVEFLRDAVVADIAGRTLQLNDDSAHGLQLILAGISNALENAAEDLRGASS